VAGGIKSKEILNDFNNDGIMGINLSFPIKINLIYIMELI
jgi:hypothetical protein